MHIYYYLQSTHKYSFVLNSLLEVTILIWKSRWFQCKIVHVCNSCKTKCEITPFYFYKKIDQVKKLINQHLWNNFSYPPLETDKLVKRELKCVTHRLADWAFSIEAHCAFFCNTLGNRCVTHNLADRPFFYRSPLGFLL